MTKKTLITSLFIGGILFVGCGDKYTPNSPLIEEDFKLEVTQKYFDEKYPTEEAWNKDYETLQKKCSYAEAWVDWVRAQVASGKFSETDKELIALSDKIYKFGVKCGWLELGATNKGYQQRDLQNKKLGNSILLK